MIIKDLVVLGRAVPELLKDGRRTICLGGYSYEHGFMRIYPTSYKSPIHRWDMVSVEVDQNDRDTRAESYKIVGSNSDYDNLHKKIKPEKRLKRADQLSLIASCSHDCIGILNANHTSLGIIKPEILSYYLRHNLKKDQPSNLMFDFLQEDIMTKKDFSMEPRVEYRCAPHCISSTFHAQQIREWGFYKWLEAHPENMQQVWDNAGFNNPDYEIYFFVGNQARYRNSYLVISVLRFKRSPIQLRLL